MKIKLLLSAFLIPLIGFAQEPIFEPTMSITGLGLVNSPVGEEVDKVIDQMTGTKFLDFELNDGIGFEVDLGGASGTAISIDVTTANDFPVRDPIDFTIRGSNDGSSFTTVANGTIDCIPDRFFTRNYEFTNSTAYSFYRVEFSAPCDPSGGTGIPSIQIAEVQLYEATLSVDTNGLLDSTVQIYPNPAIDSFTLDYSGNESLSVVSILDTSGKQVISMDASEFGSSTSINISSLEAGIYFVRINSETNSVTKKLILK